MILDHGASVTDTQLQIAKDAAQVILSAIDEHDKVMMTPVTPPIGIGSFLNTFLKVLYVLWYVFFNPPLKMTLRKESAVVFILVFKEAAANPGSKSLYKNHPHQTESCTSLMALPRLLISCDFHTGNYTKEEQG